LEFEEFPTKSDLAKGMALSFSSEFAKDHYPSQANEFWGYPAPGKPERTRHACRQMRAKIKQTTSCGVMIVDGASGKISGQVLSRQVLDLP
jgi:hypothetical protein